LHELSWTKSEIKQAFESLERYLQLATFYTPLGKRLAQERKAYAKSFLQRLKSEW
jgi:hypothetical protein